MNKQLARVVIGIAGFVCSMAAAIGAEAPQKKILPLPGENFEVDGCAAFVILPSAEHILTNRPQPWVWYAPTLPNLPGAEERWMFQRFLDNGIAIAGIDVGESYGSPQGRARFTALRSGPPAVSGASRQKQIPSSCSLGIRREPRRGLM